MLSMAQEKVGERAGLASQRGELVAVAQAGLWLDQQRDRRRPRTTPLAISADTADLSTGSARNSPIRAWTPAR
jgi:hypothetical protein